MDEEKLKMKEIGLKEYRIWRQGNLRGHRIIGQWIINRYGLEDKDLEILKKEKGKFYCRRQRMKIKLKKELPHVKEVHS